MSLMLTGLFITWKLMHAFPLQTKLQWNIYFNLWKNTSCHNPCFFQQEYSGPTPKQLHKQYLWYYNGKFLLSDQDMFLCCLRFWQTIAYPSDLNPSQPFDLMDRDNLSAINHELSIIDWSFADTFTPRSIDLSLIHHQLFMDNVANICLYSTPLPSMDNTKYGLTHSRKYSYEYKKTQLQHSYMIYIDSLRSKERSL